jgi:hypothetical protein
VRKGKKEKRTWWAQVESAGRARVLIPTLSHGRAGPGGSHSIMNKQREVWAVSSQATYMSPKLFLLLAALLGILLSFGAV